MWKTCGYIVYKGEYPVTAEYLIYDEVNEELIWIKDPNQAMIFSTVGYAKCVLERFPDINTDMINYRVVVMTDEPIKVK